MLLCRSSGVFATPATLLWSSAGVSSLHKIGNINLDLQNAAGKPSASEVTTVETQHVGN